MKMRKSMQKSYSIFFAAALATAALFGVNGSFSAHAQEARRPLERSFTLLADDFVCNSGGCFSSPFTAGFEYAAFEWPHERKVSVRWYDGKEWSAWHEGGDEVDTPDHKSGDPYFIFPISGTRVVQVRSDARPEFVRATYFSLPPVRHNQGVRAATLELGTQTSPNLIARTQWLDSGLELPAAERERVWPSEYDSIKKIIVHHTATTVRDMDNDGVLNADDYRTAIRAIYHYHTNTRKWGDIGYQFIIDPDGGVWEGRFGGDGVVGGHAWRDKACSRFSTGSLGFNKGTIGIALLGTFTDASITPAAKEALVELIAKKSWEFEVQPAGNSFFNDQTYPNIIGHRDVDCTACPGAALYNQLLDITLMAQQRFDERSSGMARTYTSERADGESVRIEARADEEKEIVIRMKNTGTMPWRRYGERPIYLASASVTQHLGALRGVQAASEPTPATRTTDPLAFRVAQLTTPNVMPGETGAFSFKVRAEAGTYLSRQNVVMALGSSGWIEGSEVSIAVVNRSLEYAAERSDPSVTHEFFDDGEKEITLLFANKGSKTWKRGDLVLQILSEAGGESTLRSASWKASDGRFVFKEETVAPDGTATFSFPIDPRELGTTNMRVALLKDGESIPGSDAHPVRVTVKPAYAFSVSASEMSERVAAGSHVRGRVRLVNAGEKEWNDARLVVVGLKKGETSPLNPAWRQGSVVANISPKTVGLLKEGTAAFSFTAPKAAGEYVLHLALQQSGGRLSYLSPLENKRQSFSYSLTVFPPPDPAFSKRMAGAILLQVESKGEAWYVNPADSMRHYLGRPNDAFRIMRNLGLGATHEFIETHRDKEFPTPVIGKILLDVGDSGKAYYIYPKDRRAYYLGRPDDAFKVMRELGLGISNTNLMRIASSDK